VDLLIPVSFDRQAWTGERSTFLPRSGGGIVAKDPETATVRRIRMLELEHEIRDIRRDTRRGREENRILVYGSRRDVGAYLRREIRGAAISDLSYELDRGRDLQRDIELSVDRARLERRVRVLDHRIRIRNRIRSAYEPR
jgi:hypothetical protein